MKLFSSSKRKKEKSKEVLVPEHAESSVQNTTGVTFPRITRKHLFAEVAAVLNLEKGIIFSIWQFFRRPGVAFEDYLKKSRRKYANPIRILVLSSAILVFLNLNFAISLDEVTESIIEQMEDGTLHFSMWGDQKFDSSTPEGLLKQKHFVRRVVNSISSAINWFTLLSVPFFALFTRLFMRKKKYFYWEHFAAFAFMQSISNVIGILFFPVLLVHLLWFFLLFFIQTAYIIYAIKRIHGERKFRGSIKTLFVYFFAFIVFQFIFLGLFALFVQTALNT